VFLYKEEREEMGRGQQINGGNNKSMQSFLLFAKG
jgi:hypothetical protein